jgi:hypothetical protein
MVLQGFMVTRQLCGVDLAIVAGVVALGWGLAAPFAVIGHHVDGAVAVPIGVVCDHRVGGGVRACAGISGLFHGAVVITHLNVCIGKAELFPVSAVVGLQLQKGVVVEHLLDFLAQFERRQLQQPDRLLQLRRERQMLRDAQRQPLLH